MRRALPPGMIPQMAPGVPGVPGADDDQRPHASGPYL
jgi:hypothetical protein